MYIYMENNDQPHVYLQKCKSVKVKSVCSPQLPIICVSIKSTSRSSNQIPRNCLSNKHFPQFLFPSNLLPNFNRYYC